MRIVIAGRRRVPNRYEDIGLKQWMILIAISIVLIAQILFNRPRLIKSTDLNCSSGQTAFIGDL